MDIGAAVRGPKDKDQMGVKSTSTEKAGHAIVNGFSDASSDKVVHSGKEDDLPPPYSPPKRARIQFDFKRFFRKFFLEGQKLSESQSSALQNLSPDAPWHEKLLVGHRRLVGVLIPFVFFQTIWWCLAVKNNFFAYFPDRFLLSITMVFGATIGGMTSEGGGAVAFPVMTLALGIKPAVARDFSLMIQSCGMTSAAFAIIWMKIQLEWHSIFFCSFGAIFGLVFGLDVIDPLLSSDEKKLGFVSIWFSFAFALYLLNRQFKRKTYDSIPNFGAWQCAILLVTGFIGGIFSALCGSGVDICSFSILSLLFRVNEKVSTPTSVVLMAINTACGFFWRQFMTETGAEPEAWRYLAVCVPVVVFFGPFGSFLSSHFHRKVLAMFIYVLDTLALVSALFLIPLDWQLGILIAGLVLGGFVFFYILSKIGERLVISNMQSENETNSRSTSTCKLSTTSSSTDITVGYNDNNNVDEMPKNAKVSYSYTNSIDITD